MCLASNLRPDSQRCFLHRRIIWLLLFLLPTSPLMGQAVSELPRAEYYVAKELFGAGRIAEAAEGFAAAGQRARRIGEQRWIDSIPPLVMLGECYYQQGNLTAAMEQYDAALMLMLNYPKWIDRVEAGTEQLPFHEAAAKGINWFTMSVAARTVAIPEAIEIAIDPLQAQVGPQGGIVAPISLVTRLDSTEIFRTLAVAMSRRNQILGPLARHSPLSEPLAQAFMHEPLPQAAWVVASWRLLRGLSKLSTATAAEAPGLIRGSVLLGGQYHYFMSPLALTAIAELEARQGNYAAAITSLQDASLLAAELEQHSELADSLRLLSACGAASQRLELLEPLQNVAAWSSKRSNLARSAAFIGAAEIAVYAGNIALADKLAKQAALIFRAREITLPRDRAALAFANALIGFAQNRSTLGYSNLEAALKLMHGNAQTGAVAERIFQAQMTLDLLAGGQLTPDDCDAILARVLAEPSRSEWELDTLKTLATITTASLPAYERLLELAVDRGDESAVLSRLDRLQRQRFYESLPLGGRQLSVRHAIATDPSQLPQSSINAANIAFQVFPELKNSQQQMQAMVKQVHDGQLPLDERQLPAAEKRLFTELEELALSIENQVALFSIRRTPIERFLPGEADSAAIQAQLAADDVVLAMATTGQSIIGIAVTKQQIQHWQVAEVNETEVQLNELLINIGLVRQATPVLPSAILAGDAAWKNSAQSLLTKLFPSDVQDLIAASKRVIIAPNGRLWYLPFELLPVSAKAGASRWIEDRAITYVPTLGGVHTAFNAIPTVKNSVGIIGSPFATNKEESRAISEQLLTRVSNASGLFLDAKLAVPSPAWLGICTDQLWLAARIEPAVNLWETPIMQFGRGKQTNWGSWLSSPRASPAAVVMPGLVSAAASGTLGSGNELFLPACGMLLSGTRSAMLSRWPVGGRSTAVVLERYLEDSRSEAASTALRRALLSLWTEEFLIAEEPALLPAGKESAALCSGQHPLLWSSYMSVGDTLKK